MKIKIRKSYFETNSSSIHAIVLPKDLGRIEMPTKANLYLIDNLTDRNIIAGFEDKLSFLATVLYANKSSIEIRYLIRILKDFGISVNIIDDRITDIIAEGKQKDVYIPHFDSLSIIVRQILYNKELLLRYLFNNTIIDYDLDSNILSRYYSDIYDILV